MCGSQGRVEGSPGAWVHPDVSLIFFCANATKKSEQLTRFSYIVYGRKPGDPPGTEAEGAAAPEDATAA